MKAFLVWLETDMAKIFDLEPGEPDPGLLHRHLVVHYSGLVEDPARDCSRFFQRITKNIQGAGEILLVGPGPRKRHFHNYLSSNHAPLAGAVVGVEDSGDLSDKELLAFSRRFFHRLDALQSATAGA